MGHVRPTYGEKTKSIAFGIIRMENRSSIGIIFLLVFGLQACATDQTRLQNQNARLQDELKHFQLQLYDAERRIQGQNAEIARLQQAEAACIQTLTDLKAQNASLKNINIKLTREVERLNSALEKNQYLETIARAGFKNVKIVSESTYTIDVSQELKGKITSVQVEAYKSLHSLSK